jgi:hypothetical protein
MLIKTVEKDGFLFPKIHAKNYKEILSRMVNI